MNEQDVRSIVSRVLSEFEAASSEKEILIEASARHVHLTKQALETLFGKGATLEKKRELSQPGEFLSDKRVKLVTADGEILNVAVLGPERNNVQVELSRTDLRALKLSAPINLSGDLKNAASVYIVGDVGMLSAKDSVIVAKAHVHLTPDGAKSYGVKDGDIVKIKVKSERPLTFEDVIVRVNKNFSTAVHIDFDEANACALKNGDKAYLKK